MEKKEFFNFDKGFRRLTRVAYFLSVLAFAVIIISGVSIIFDSDEENLGLLFNGLIILGYIWIYYFIVRFIINGFRDTEIDDRKKGPDNNFRNNKN